MLLTLPRLSRPSDTSCSSADEHEPQSITLCCSQACIRSAPSCSCSRAQRQIPRTELGTLSLFLQQQTDAPEMLIRTSLQGVAVPFFGLRGIGNFFAVPAATNRRRPKMLPRKHPCNESCPLFRFRSPLFRSRPLFRSWMRQNHPDVDLTSPPLRGGA